MQDLHQSVHLNSALVLRQDLSAPNQFWQHEKFACDLIIGHFFQSVALCLGQLFYLLTVVLLSLRFTSLQLLFQRFIPLLVLLNNAFIDCDAKQGDRLLKLVEFVWLVIIRTLLPNCSQFSGGDWDFKVFAELIVALKSKHDQVVSYLAEVASLISILATVEIEHFKEVLVNDFLFFRSHRGGRSDIVRVFFNIDLLF